MMRKGLAYFFVLFFLLNTLGRAQEEGIESAVNYKVNKMKKELQLTDAQSDAVGPVIKEYMMKKEALLQEVAGEGIVDHTAVKSTIKGLKDREYEKLSKILTADQMKKWIEKENIMATLNPDSPESSVDEDAAITPTGANLKF